MSASVVVLVWELSIPGCRSLKAKRTVLRSLTDRMKNRFNLSVAETDFQDVHDRAQITAALVTSDGRQAESLSDRIDGFVAEDGRFVVSSFHRERI
jgi:uncharacterized protein